jgi:hypothetical protein
MQKDDARKLDHATLEALRMRAVISADALQAICELDLSDLQAIEPPQGVGRD